MTGDLKRAARGLAAVVALSAFAAQAAGDGRLLAMEAAEPIDHVVIGLQRTAVPLFAGFALDTSLLGNIALAPNLGVRWGSKLGDHAGLALGVRYTLFVGTDLYSQFIQGQQPLVKRFDPSFSGPSAYAAFGYDLGAITLSAEARYSHFYYDAAGVNAAVQWHLSEKWAVVGEIGVHILGPPPIHAALGIRFTGDNFGFSLGAAYVGIDDPLLPSIPILPAIDLSWSFT